MQNSRCLQNSRDGIACHQNNKNQKKMSRRPLANTYLRHCATRFHDTVEGECVQHCQGVLKRLLLRNCRCGDEVLHHVRDILSKRRGRGAQEVRPVSGSAGAWSKTVSVGSRGKAKARCAPRKSLRRLFETRLLCTHTWWFRCGVDVCTQHALVNTTSESEGVRERKSGRRERVRE